MSNKPVRAKGSGIRLLDGALVVAGGVIAVVIGFAVLHFVAGFIWELVKIVVIVGIIGGLVWALGRRRRR
jgi:hypothetical protein